MRRCANIIYMVKHGENMVLKKTCYLKWHKYYFGFFKSHINTQLYLVNYKIMGPILKTFITFYNHLNKKTVGKIKHAG